MEPSRDMLQTVSSFLDEVSSSHCLRLSRSDLLSSCDPDLVSSPTDEESRVNTVYSKKPSSTANHRVVCHYHID